MRTMKRKCKQQSTVNFLSMIYMIIVANFKVKLFMNVVKVVITSVYIFFYIFFTSTLIKKLLKTLGK